MVPKMIKELFTIKKLDLSLAIFIGALLVSLIGSMRYSDPLKMVEFPEQPPLTISDLIKVRLLPFEDTT